jgi:hypothetical protein
VDDGGRIECFLHNGLIRTHYDYGAGQDKGILKRLSHVPFKRWIITASYFIYNFVTTVIITTVAFACVPYLPRGKRRLYHTFGDVMMTLVVLLMSAFKPTLFTVFVCGLFRTEAALTGFISIISAVIRILYRRVYAHDICPRVAVCLGAPSRQPLCGYFPHILCRVPWKTSARVCHGSARQTERIFAMKYQLFRGKHRY